MKILLFLLVVSFLPMGALANVTVVKNKIESVARKGAHQAIVHPASAEVLPYSRLPVKAEHLILKRTC